jgi:hypothetical protein
MEAKVNFLRKWFLQYFEADQSYIEEYLKNYQYGGLKRFREWLKASQPALDVRFKILPLPIFDKKTSRDKKLIFII